MLVCPVLMRISYDRQAMALLTITCSCGHIGVVAQRMLPRDLKCSRCGSVHHVERSDQPDITTKAAAMARAWSRYKSEADRAERRLRRIEQRKQQAAAVRAGVPIATEVSPHSR